MSKNLSVQWTKHLKTDQEKKKLEDAIRHSTVALGRLKEILVEQLGSLEASETKTNVYDRASWPFYQAHLNGEKKRLKDLIELLGPF